jgi:ABC-type Fe3+-hydroxamate transport system substrate-binding protein
MNTVDALGRTIIVDRAPRRIVSLVPSETESVVELAGLGVLAGRTDYCIEPKDVASLPSVGGTKGFDVAAVVALAPDLVLANKEENGRAPVQRLIDAGLTVHVSFPCSLDEAADYVDTLARMLRVDSPIVAAVRAAVRGRAIAARRTVFCPIWKDPWMTFDGRTFASDMLAAAGAENAFADRPRLYPLAADLGRARAVESDRDTRYPRVTLEEIERRRPDLVLLPDEPYAFGEEDVTWFEDRGFRARPVDGKDLFWYGTRVRHAIGRLASVVH